MMDDFVKQVWGGIIFQILLWTCAARKREGIHDSSVSLDVWYWDSHFLRLSHSREAFFRVLGCRLFFVVGLICFVFGVFSCTSARRQLFYH